MIYAVDEAPAAVHHEGDDELEGEGESEADEEVIEEDELVDAAEE